MAAPRRQLSLVRQVSFQTQDDPETYLQVAKVPPMKQIQSNIAGLPFRELKEMVSNRRKQAWPDLVRSESLKQSRQFALSWINLKFVVRNWWTGQEKVLLDNVSGLVEFGTLTALMGPSGAGKSTLLKVINGRLENGEMVSKTSRMYSSKVRKLRTCFIVQDQKEHLMMGLTVREAMLYASKLKNSKMGGSISFEAHVDLGPNLGPKSGPNSGPNFGPNSGPNSGPKFGSNSGPNLGPNLGPNSGPKSGPNSGPKTGSRDFDHVGHVNRILNELDLLDAADTAIGHCSGGQQKRLVIAQELVSLQKPNLLCIDEPTSGLDSNAAEAVIGSLQSLARKQNIAVVMAIHQPNQDILVLFDRLYVLGRGGTCLYWGPPRALRAHLADCSVLCSEAQIPIEQLMKQASKVGQRSEGHVGSTDSGMPPEVAALVDANKKLFPEFKKFSKRNGSELQDAVIPRKQPPFCFRHFWELTKRGFKANIVRLWRANLIILLFSVGTAASLCFIFGDVGADSGCIPFNPDDYLNMTLCMTFEESLRQESDILQNIKFLYFALIDPNFIFVVITVTTFPYELRIFFNEHHNRWYSTSAYYWARSLVDLPLLVLNSYLFFWVAYSKSGQGLGSETGSDLGALGSELGVPGWDPGNPGWDPGNQTGIPKESLDQRGKTEVFEEQFMLGLSRRYLLYQLVNGLGLACGQGISYFVSIAASKSLKVALTFTIGSFLFFVLYCGFFVPVKDFGLFGRSVSRLSYLRFVFENSLILLYGMERCGPEESSLPLYQIGLNDDLFWINVAWLAAALILWRVLALFVLVVKANGLSLNVFGCGKEDEVEPFESVDEESQPKV